MDENDFGVAIHDSKGLSGERNLHAHVVFAPKTRKGDKEYSLNLTKSELKGLYREWERFLKEKGYSLRRSPVRGEPHFGPQRLRFDSRARASYRHLTRAKQLWREAIEEEQIAKTLERAVQVQPAEGLLTWDEIAQEEERIATRGERKRESVKSPPPRPSRLQQPKPVKQVKPVTKPKPVRSVQQQPKVSVLSQRPSQSVEEPGRVDGDAVKQIKRQVERELAAKKKREQRLAEEINRSTKQQARELSRSESPPPPSASSYPKEKAPQEVGMNPFVTQQVIEEREQEKEQQLKQVQVYQAEMRITYRFRYVQGKLTIRFRTLASWTPEQRKGMAAFLASVAVAALFGYEYPRESLLYYGEFVYREAVAVKEQVRKTIKKPFYPSSEEALQALSVKRVVHVRVRVYENGKLVEQFNFFLTKESFTIMHSYAEAVLKRRRPQPPGQGQGQPPQGEPPEPPDDEEPDWPEPPGM